MSQTDPALERIESALTALGAEHVPPIGWEARVLASTAPPRRTRWWIWAAPLGVAAAVVVAFLLVRPDSPRPLELAVSVEQGGALVRGANAHVGDSIVASASGGGRQHAVWIYRDDRLVLACGNARPCRLVLATPGDYTVVALAADGEIAAPRGRLDDDVATAARAGTAYQMEPLAVR